MFFSCSSVQRINGKTFQIPALPVLEKAREGLITGNKGSGGKDYKERKKSSGIPVYTFAPILFPEGFSDLDKRIIEQELKLLWKNSSFQEVELPFRVWVDRDSLQKASMKKNIDAYIYTNILIDKPEKEKTDKISYTIKQDLKDPVNASLFGSLEYKLEVLKDTEEDKKPFERIELVRSKDRYRLLSEEKVPEFSFSRQASKEELKTLLLKSISGVLQINTVSSDCEFYLDGKEAGKLPVKDFPILEGTHKLKIYKTGAEEVEREVTVRAGDSLNLFIEWKDDFKLSSMGISTYPSGLKVAWNSEIQGESPLYLNNLPPARYNINILKDLKEKKNSSLFKWSLELKAKDSSYISFPFYLKDAVGEEAQDFWTVSGNGSLEPKLGGGLLFKRKKERESSGWNGVFSKPFPPASLKLEAAFPFMEKEENLYFCFFEKDKPRFIIETVGERVSLYDTKFGLKTMDSFTFKKEKDKTDRAFHLEIDSDSAKAKLGLGGRDLLFAEVDTASEWRLAVLVRDMDSEELKALNSLSLTYTEFTDLFIIRDKEEDKNNDKED